MALGTPFFVDGFDALSGAAGLETKWDVFTNGSSTMSLTSGRQGGNALRFGETAGNVALRKYAPAGINRFSIGFAMRFRPTTGNLFQDAFDITTVGDGSRYNILNFSTTRQIQYQRTSSGSTVLWTSTQFPANAWFYLELEVFLNASTGYAKIYIDGIKVFEALNINTLGSGTTLDAVSFRLNPWLQPIDIDDLVFTDFTGDTSPTLFGPARITTWQPTSVDTNVGWTAGGGAASVTDGVAGTFPADDTKYAEAANLNDILLMASTGTVPAAVGAVRALAVNARHQKTDGAARALSHVLKSGGTEYVATPDVPLISGVTASQRIWALDPATAAAWTAANAEAAAFGVKVTT